MKPASSTTSRRPPREEDRAEAGATVLVSGAMGLLGREVVGQLTAEARHVRGIDRCSPTPPAARDVEHVTGDLLDREACRRACEGVRTIVHTAALQHHSTVPRWGCERYFRQNVAMTQNLVDAALEAGVANIVMVSSDMVYGMPPKRPIRETDPPRPIGPYGRSKLASEGVCTACRERGVRVCILRPRLIVGPGRVGVLARLFDRIRAGKSVPILGAGVQRYQMVAVSDVAAACMLAVRTPRDGTFNLGSSDPPPVRELMADLIARAGSQSAIRVLPATMANIALWSLNLLCLAPLRPEQYRIASVDYVLDTSRAESLLGWRPKHSDADMLWQAYQTYVASLQPRG